MAGFASLNNRSSDSSRRGARLFLGLMVMTILLAPRGLLAASAQEDTLLVVNGEVITAADLDQLIMESHSMFRMETETSGLVDKVLNKRTNDILIIQDAYAAGMDEEPAITELVADSQRKYATEAFVAATLVLPATVPQDSVRAYFERYYWKIQLRRLSVRTRAEAEELRASVLAGADMDALAREVSLDTKKPTGGLYNVLYWADIENRIRDQVGHLKAGEISEVFPYNDAFTFVRVEERYPVDEPAFASLEPSIIPAVRKVINQEAWDAFIDGLIARYGVEEDLAGMAAIVADSSLVIKGEFIKDDDSPVIEIPGGPAASSRDLREAIQREALQDAMEPFGAHLDKGRRRVTSGLVLARGARDGGYFEDPDVMAKTIKDEENALIESYLADVIVPKIKFNREELDQVYQENIEAFRGPDQYRLDILFLDEEAEAKEAAQRLAEGADFAFIWKEYRPGEEVNLGQSNFITQEQLSQPFRVHLQDMEVGQCSPAIEMSMGWMIFKLDAIRKGEVAPIEKVEMEIRKVVYQEKFNQYLDEHLELLKQQSDIDRREDRIKAYILAGE